MTVQISSGTKGVLSAVIRRAQKKIDDVPFDAKQQKRLRLPLPAFGRHLRGNYVASGRVTPGQHIQLFRPSELGGGLAIPCSAGAVFLVKLPLACTAGDRVVLILC